MLRRDHADAGAGQREPKRLDVAVADGDNREQDVHVMLRETARRERIGYVHEGHPHRREDLPELSLDGVQV